MAAEDRPVMGPPQLPESLGDALDQVRDDFDHMPPLRKVLTYELIREAMHSMRDGSWPAELPHLLNIPEDTWFSWLRKGQRDRAERRDTIEGDLRREISRGRVLLAKGVRRQMLDLISRGKSHAPAAYVLSQLLPDMYNVRVNELVREQIDKALSLASQSIPDEHYAAFCAAIEAGLEEAAAKVS